MVSPSRPLETHAVRVATIVAAAALALVIPCVYVPMESTVHWWDYGLYHDIAIETTRAFSESPRAGGAAVLASLERDYTAVFALPLVPLLRLLGESRLAYEVSLALVYVLPLALVVGSLAVRFVPQRPMAVQASAVMLTLVLPMSWASTLRGYPDAGGALLLFLAMRLQVAGEGHGRALRIAATGLLLAASVVFRRHFIFAVPVFLAAAAAQEAVSALGASSGSRARRLAAGGTHVATLAASTLLWLALIGRGFLHRILADDFFTRYAAYLETPGHMLRWYVECYGWLVLGAAVVGLAVAVRRARREHNPTVFIVAYGVATVLVWAFVARQEGEHYAWHSTPVVALGLCALLWTPAATATRRGVATATWAVLLGNLVYSLAPASPGAPIQIPAPLLVVAARWPPLRRSDIGELQRLVDTLRQNAGAHQPVLTVASSRTLNPDLLRRAERQYHGREALLEVLEIPSVDSRDPYPVEMLLRANWAVVPQQLQLHLGLAEQRLVATLHTLFASHAAAAGDFESLPGMFVLEGGVHVSILERVRPSQLATGVATLRAFEDAIPSPSPVQPDWVVVSQRFPSWVEGAANSPARLVMHPLPRNAEPPAAAVYRRPAPLMAQLSGTVEFLDARCGGAALVLSSLDADGAWGEGTEIVRRPGQPGSFEVSTNVLPDRRLALRLTVPEGQASIDHCLLRLDRLTVRSVGDRAEATVRAGA